MAINQVSQTGLKDTSLLRFRGILDNGGTVAKGCRYIVTITPPGDLIQRDSGRRYKEMDYLCESASFPGRGFSVTQARYYGPSQVFPTNAEYEPMSLIFICRADSTERRFFDDWLDYINPVNTFNFQYPNKYYSTVDIYAYSEYAREGSGDAKGLLPNITYHWRLNKAWPTLVADQPVNWADQEVMKLQVSFAYKYWDRPNIISGWSGNNGDSPPEGGSPNAVLDTNIAFA